MARTRQLTPVGSEIPFGPILGAATGVVGAAASYLRTYARAGLANIYNYHIPQFYRQAVKQTKYEVAKGIGKAVTSRLFPSQHCTYGSVYGRPNYRQRYQTYRPMKKYRRRYYSRNYIPYRSFNK